MSNEQKMSVDFILDRMSSALSTATLSDNLVSYASGSIAILHTELNLRQTLLGGQSFR